MTVVSENDALTVTVAGDNADPVNIRWTSRDKGSFSMSGSVSSSRKRMVTPDPSAHARIIDPKILKILQHLPGILISQIRVRIHGLGNDLNELRTTGGQMSA